MALKIHTAEGESTARVELVPTGAFGFDCDFCGQHSDAMIAVQFTQEWLGDPAGNDGPDMVEIACTSHLAGIDSEITQVVKID